MPGFTSHTGSIAVIPDDNVDTDRIIPARYLTMVTKSGYGELLFHDVRGGGFPLDQPASAGATVLVVGTNFGCGSSREHAVWAIQQAGFLAVIARRDEDSAAYSDIFRQNGANCGLLLAEMAPDDHAKLLAAGSGTTVTVELPTQQVNLRGESLPFDINPATKNSLLNGLDLIGTTLIHGADITAFEATNTIFTPSEASR